MKRKIEYELENVSSDEECVSLSESVSLLCKYIPQRGLESWEVAINEVQVRYAEEADENDDFPDYEPTYKQQDDYDEMFTSLLCKN